MLITFLAALILLSFAFHLLVALVAMPIALTRALLWQQRRYKAHILDLGFVVFNQSVISLLYAICIAVMTHRITSSDLVTVSWPYFVIAMGWVFFTLGSNAAGQATERGQFDLRQTSEHRAAATGAIVGVLVGLVAFPLFYNFPELALFTPGAVWLLSWPYKLAHWLSEFWVVRLVLLFVVAGYALKVGIATLVGGITLLNFLSSRITQASGDATI